MDVLDLSDLTQSMKCIATHNATDIACAVLSLTEVLTSTASNAYLDDVLPHQRRFAHVINLSAKDPISEIHDHVDSD